MIILFFGSLTGGVSALSFSPGKTSNVKLLLSFSGAYLLSISILYLIPDAYGSLKENIGLFVLFGFVLQIILEQMTTGIEHGHMHVGGSTMPWVILFGLCIHGFLEGMPLAGNFQFSSSGHNIQSQLFWGILLHHVPSAFVLVALFQSIRLKTNRIVILLVIVSAAVPLGAIAGKTFLSDILAEYFPYIIALVIGIFLHLSTTILFESSGEEHQLRWKKFIAICLGIVTALITLFA